MNIKGLWIIHPRSKRPDAALTFAVFAVATALFKFLTNGVIITVMDQTFNLGTVDSGLIAAILVPTLGAYVGRKMSDTQVNIGDKSE